MRQRWFGSLLLALGLSGCSALINVDGVQCNADADCTSKQLGDICVHNVCVNNAGADNTDAGMVDSSSSGCTMDLDCKSADAPSCMHGSCVEKELAARFLCGADQSEQLSETVHYSFQVLEFITRKPPEELVVLACRSNDVTCSDPSASWQDTDGTGLVELDLPFGFMGYFDVTSKTTLQALSYLTKPLIEDKRDRDLQVAAPSTVQALASISGVPFDESKGLAMVEAFDCSKTPVGGVHFTESKGSSTAFYLVNHVPNSELTMSVYDETNNVADGGFINVLPGFVTFTAHYGVDGPTLGEFNAQVRASAMTYIDMYF